MNETIKRVVLRALEARMEQCQKEMALCTETSQRPGVLGSSLGNIVNEHYSYWSGELSTAIGAHKEIAGVTA